LWSHVEQASLWFFGAAQSLYYRALVTTSLQDVADEELGMYGPASCVMGVKKRPMEALMRLALASNFAPDRRPLSEYGYHLAGGLRATADSHELVVLSGKFSTDQAPGVWRVWDDGNTQIPVQIVRALRHHRADGLLLNTHFTTWGSNRANLAGLLTPLFARRAGFKVTTLLHHLPHTIDAKRVGYRLSPLHRLGIQLGCRAVAASNVVCFTLKRDLDVFEKR